MEIYFKRRRDQELFSSERKLVKKFGQENAEKIQQRLSELAAAESLEDMSFLKQARCHELAGRRKGQFAVDLKHPFRLVFTPFHSHIPRKEDGGIDRTRVTRIIISGVEDYHG